MHIWHQGFVEIDGVGAAAGYREALEAHVAALARPGTTVSIHGMPPGSFAGTSPAEVARHAYLSGLYTNAVIDSLLAGQAAGADAAIVGILQDLGVDEARSLLDIPVAGYGEAAMHLACFLGRRFAILAFNSDLFDLLEARIDRAGLRSRAAPLTIIDTDYAAVSHGFRDPAPVLAAFTAAARRAIAAGADVLIPGQMILSEVLWREQVRQVDGVPVVDGMGACVKLAESLVDLRRVSGMTVARRGFWGATPPAAVVDRARRRFLAD